LGKKINDRLSVFVSHKGGKIITRRRRYVEERNIVFCAVTGENGKHTTSGE